MTVTSPKQNSISFMKGGDFTLM